MYFSGGFFRKTRVSLSCIYFQLVFPLNWIAFKPSEELGNERNKIRDRLSGNESLIFQKGRGFERFGEAHLEWKRPNSGAKG